MSLIAVSWQNEGKEIVENLIETKNLRMMRLKRVGKILSNFCILGGAFSILCFASPILQFGAIILGAMVCFLALIPQLCTLATSGVWIDDLGNFFFNGLNGAMDTVRKGLFVGMPYVFGVMVAVAAAAITLLSVGKRVNVARIVIVSLCLVLGIIAMIISNVVPLNAFEGSTV